MNVCLIQVTRTQVWQQSVVWACCFHSDNLYGPWFEFITECVFDNTDMEGALLWRHVSDVRTSRTVKRCLNLLNHQLWNCGSRSTTGVPSIVYSYAAIIQQSKHKKEKQNIERKHKPRLLHNTHRCSPSYVFPTCCRPVVPISSFRMQ